MSRFVDWLVLTDGAVAVLLLLLAPLFLTALAIRDTTVRRRMLTYWRAFLILPVSLFLIFQDQAFGQVTFLVGFVAIPVALWVGDAVYTLPPTSLPRGGPLRRSYRSWRWLVTVYCGAGLVLSMLTLLCVLETGPTTFCEVRLSATGTLAYYLQPGVDPRWIVIPSYAAGGLYLAYAIASARVVLRRMRRSPI